MAPVCEIVILPNKLEQKGCYKYRNEREAKNYSF